MPISVDCCWWQHAPARRWRHRNVCNVDAGGRFGEQSYNITSSAWAGVFAKIKPQQVDSIATEIFGSIKPR